MYTHHLQIYPDSQSGAGVVSRWSLSDQGNPHRLLSQNSRCGAAYVLLVKSHTHTDHTNKSTHFATCFDEPTPSLSLANSIRHSSQPYGRCRLEGRIQKHMGRHILCHWYLPCCRKRGSACKVLYITVLFCKAVPL